MILNLLFLLNIHYINYELCNNIRFKSGSFEVGIKYRIMCEWMNWKETSTIFI